VTFDVEDRQEAEGNATEAEEVPAAKPIFSQPEKRHKKRDKKHEKKLFFPFVWSSFASL
jgi:hypothetical protein